MFETLWTNPGATIAFNAATQRYDARNVCGELLFSDINKDIALAWFKEMYPGERLETRAVWDKEYEEELAMAAAVQKAKEEQEAVERHQAELMELDRIQKEQAEIEEDARKYAGA